MGDSRWIKMSEKLPEPYSTVLMFDGRTIHKAYFDPQGGQYAFDCDTYGCPIDCATHWQLFPEPPDDL
jgi:hypothetical protein